MKNLVLFLSVQLLVCVVMAQDIYHQLFMMPEASDVSFRGISLAPDGSLWLAGAKGIVVRKVGNNESLHLVLSENAPDLRGIWAFDAENAIAVGIGSPALIFRTADGGTTWKVVHTDARPEAFLDGISFWDRKNGLVYGDPIDGKMILLLTRDGGQTWNPLPENSRPTLEKGEASFAASGTGIQCIGKRKVVVATGGAISRLWVSENRGKTWRAVEVPILQGKESQGIFSFHFLNDKKAVAVGGDYLQDSLNEQHIYLTEDGGRTWQFPKSPTRGYRECVRYLDTSILMACGPSGIDISVDGGLNWQPFSDEKGFHVMVFFPMGKAGFAAGAKGRWARIEMQ